MDGRQQSDGGRIRKRKAESDSTQDGYNERLSKRLSQLNLERTGNKLSLLSSVSGALSNNGNHSIPSVPVSVVDHQASRGQPQSITSRNGSSIKKNASDDDIMQIDNTAHKVYIYNLDDELSDSESSSDEAGKLRFHPDLKKHFAQNKKHPLDFTPTIVPQVRTNSEGELGGVNLRNELVLYNVPSSLTVPEDRDSVRKAIIETRARARETQRREREAARTRFVGSDEMIEPYMAEGYAQSLMGGTTGARAAGSSPPRPTGSLAEDIANQSGAILFPRISAPLDIEESEAVDADAMDID